MKYLGKSENTTTWEPADCIPPWMINLYENREETVVTLVDDNYSGQISSTIKSASPRDVPCEPRQKRRKEANNEIPEEG